MRRIAPLLVVALWALPAAAQSAPELSLETKLTLSFAETQLQLILEAMQKSARVNVVVDPSLDAWALRASAEASDESVGEFLDQIQEQLKLERTVWCDAIYLHPQGKGPGEEPAAPEGEGARRLAQRVGSVNFLRTSLPQVLERLEGRTKVKMRLPSRVRAQLRDSGRSVTLILWNARLRHVLTHVSRACGLSWSVSDAGEVSFALTEAAAAPETQVDTINYRAQEGLAGAPKLDLDRLITRLANPRARAASKAQLVAAGKQAAPKLAKLLRTADPATATAALQALGEIGDPGEYGAVLAVFKDTERSLELRTVAGQTLAAMKAPETIPDLIAALNDTWFRISETARQALVAIGEPAVRPLQQTFRREARDPKGKDGVIYRSLLIFGGIGGEASREELLSALRLRRGSRAVPIRHHAAIGLGMTGDPEVIEPLMDALERERNFRVAKYIARSLTWITDQELPPQAERWRAWWKLEGERAYAKGEVTADDLLDDLGGELELPVDGEGLAVLETDAERARRLIVQLADDDVVKHKAAIAGLVAMGDAGRESVKSALDHANPRVRDGAAAVLAQLDGGPRDE